MTNGLPDSPNAGDIGTPKRTREIVARYGFTFRKRLGQNFLVDGNVLRRIVEAAELGPAKGALEIGPGIGALTERLARAAGKVVAIELDRRLIPILEELLEPHRNVEIVHGDALKLDLKRLIAERFAGLDQVSVVANLPYYATTPILMKLLEDRLPLESIVVMVQKEVAWRMTAPPGGKDYGSLSVAVRYFAEPEIVCLVPRGVFVPPPNVDSAVVRLKMRERPPVDVRDEALFFRVVHAAFAQRRKTLANNLTALLGRERRREAAELPASLGIDPGRRGETLTLEEFAALANELALRQG
ncbi:MAG: 16S rRNA (adenine(1518)-N(6)/adenine(1519)-N(6))-dimethyltransferase [Thermobacillus sp. ZCTH02-B1]|uniref:16S rRNA (adenine(1518)-N(6)/adenine(1519)-N(6))- dimethyltransferase RsmA n=1 Tax=Thermobacillus sp. ZCTH02-B1 TaxID=1858795 RepID=UPI000B582499|nr:16S rRNA (adenine(1518)-N(6)/adenine(1519)-N(6))-dimethyltransferase RsmA [Thermobacillus sp. ZCTH02-B1]OUM95559.1 MAG: 16S rRNA (adenine(1518)-N(6)/adenine(1519)-N(6))-dimethyltransferase [Thermobacillus sp. ZCTH02-B1]